jgi:regulator of sirC expression with transglutaminase-like and TPR domain
VEDIGIFVDAFNGGEVMFAQDCQERLSQIYQQEVMLKPEFLAVVSNRQFLARMLTNLKYIYLQQQDLERSLAIVERVLMLFPEASFELRDRGLLYYQLGQFSQAMEDLQIYLIKVPDAKDADVIRQLLAKLN